MAKRSNSDDLPSFPETILHAEIWWNSNDKKICIIKKLARLPKPASAKAFNSYKNKNDWNSLEIVNTNLPVAAPQPASVPQSSVIFGFLKDCNV